MTQFVRRRVVTGLIAGACAAIGTTCLAVGPDRTPPSSGPAAPRGLAVTANGQTVVCIDGARKAVMAMDPTRADSWRDVVGPAGSGDPEPVAVACLAGDVVATVCRAGDTWSLRTFRTAPATVAVPSKPLQEIDLGSAQGTGDDVSVAVNHARGWLVVAGLPRPLPPILRAVVAGVRLGPLSDRSCPEIPDGCRPVAVADNHAGDLVLVLRRADRDDAIAFYDAGGRELLRLPTGMRRVTGIGFGRGDGMLWAVGTDTDEHAGLWRLDAILRHGRQAIQPVLVDAITAPVALISASERAIVVVHGKPPRTVSRIDPSLLEPVGPRSAVP